MRLRRGRAARDAATRSKVVEEARALSQDVIGRLDQMPHLGGAVVSCDLLTLVAEKVLADRAPRLRATEAPFTKGRLGFFWASRARSNAHVFDDMDDHPTSAEEFVTMR